MNIPTHCLRCGVCCHSDLPTYVRVTGEDWSRLGEKAEAVAHFIGHRAYMRMHDGHCAALLVRPSADDSGGLEYFCSVYAERPAVCRELARGSSACEGELINKQARVTSASSALLDSKSPVPVPTL